MYIMCHLKVLRQLQTLQQTMQSNASSSQHEMEEKMRKLQQMKQQEEEFDKHLAQTVPVSYLIQCFEFFLVKYTTLVIYIKFLAFISEPSICI